MYHIRYVKIFLFYRSFLMVVEIRECTGNRMYLFLLFETFRYFKIGLDLFYSIFELCLSDQILDKFQDNKKLLD